MLIHCGFNSFSRNRKLAEGDVITVSGVIKNYKGTIEFDKGCTFVK